MPSMGGHVASGLETGATLHDFPIRFLAAQSRTSRDCSTASTSDGTPGIICKRAQKDAGKSDQEERGLINIPDTKALADCDVCGI